MKPVLLAYATREGHTEQIAEYVAGLIRKRGFEAELLNAARRASGVTVHDCAGAIVAASVHRGKHQREMVEFVKEHAAELERIPTVFLSVSLSEAGAEDATATAKKRAQSAADASRLIDEFLEETGWNPGKIRAVAGALLYTKYNFLLRLIMKRIARAAGAGLDTSRNYDYTDWGALDQLVDEFIGHLGVGALAAAK